MTSRRPCWRTKLILWDLNSIFMQILSCFSNSTWLLVMWVETLHCGVGHGIGGVTGAGVRLQLFQTSKNRQNWLLCEPFLWYLSNLSLLIATPTWVKNGCLNSRASLLFLLTGAIKACALKLSLILNEGIVWGTNMAAILVWALKSVMWLHAVPCFIFDLLGRLIRNVYNDFDVLTFIYKAWRTTFIRATDSVVQYYLKRPYSR